MKKSENIMELTSEVMEAYLTGTLNDRDRHRVEKLLLEDDFASEAIDGLELLDATSRTESIEKIHNRLNQRLRPAKTTNTFTWYAVAAVFVILVSTTYLLLRKTDAPLFPETKGISENTPSPQEQTPFSDEPRENDESLAEGAEHASAEVNAIEEERVSKDSQPRSSAGNLAFSTTEDDEIKSFNDSIGMVLGDVSPERISQIDTRTVDTLRITEILPAASEELSRSPTKVGRLAGEPLREELLVGQIILQDGMPVANVDVLVEGTEIRTRTDEQGHFEIDTKSDATLVLSMMGLKSKTVESQSIKQQNGENIVMDQESTVLSELTLSNGEATRGASPVIGIKAYEAYLQQNRNNPEVNAGRSGEVIIRVTIESDGTLSNTKIVRSLGESYDMEAIRLIREGPAWQAAAKDGLPVKDKVRVKIFFD